MTASLLPLSAYFSAFTIGLLGSAHCLGMCGGISSALSLSIQRSQRHPVILLLGYHLGRITSYALAGLLLGSLGWFLGQASPVLHITLRILAGAMLIAMGLYLSGLWQGLARLEQAGGWLWRHIQPRANRLLPVRSLSSACALGALWGWLPCGMVYSTLSWSASYGGSLASASLMVSFGLGTLPAVLLTGLFARQLQRIIQARLTRSLAATLIVTFGLWTLPGPHQKALIALLGFGD